MPAQALASSFCCQGGAFEAAFAGAGVDFNRERGAFRVHRNCVGEVELVGEGLARYWTARTLEREGVHVIRRNVRVVRTRAVDWTG